MKEIARELGGCTVPLMKVAEAHRRSRRTYGASRVIGWACAPTLHANLVLCALQRALKHRRPSRGLLHRSDRGVQYVCEDYVAAREGAGIERRMSRAGNCYDNAVIESFWSTLKRDTGLDTHAPATRRAAELVTFDCLETFCNPTRRPSSRDYLSPVAFEKLHQKAD